MHTSHSNNSPTFKEQAVLVHLNLSHHDEDALREFKELALATGAKTVSVVTGFYKKPNPKYFIGKGKVEEIKKQIEHTHANLVFFDHELSPAQERNLERSLECRVLDRTGLILDIFARRARTFEGRLQVELAQLQHLSTRLIRGWTHLERQRGGIGLRGPGETQLEVDRRLIGQRIKSIKNKLSKVRSQRNQGRRTRKRANIPIISLVGYTNAGKSTLFNRLTSSDAFVADQLFATLDTTLRKIKLPTIGTAILVDTVGFIRKLPHDLIDAFHATLEETQEADLLIHVIDSSYHDHQKLISQVNQVLKEIQADHIPQLKVYNKIDRLSHKKLAVDKNRHGQIESVWISALEDIGIGLLHQALVEQLGKDKISLDLILKSDQGKLRAALHEKHAIIKEETDKEGNLHIQAQMCRSDYYRLKRNFKDVLPNV